MYPCPEYLRHKIPCSDDPLAVFMVCTGVGVVGKWTELQLSGRGVYAGACEGPGMGRDGHASCQGQGAGSPYHCQVPEPGDYKVYLSR